MEENLTIEELSKHKSLNVDTIKNHYFGEGVCGWCKGKGELYLVFAGETTVIYTLCENAHNEHRGHMRDVTIKKKLNAQEIFTLQMIINGSLAE